LVEKRGGDLNEQTIGERGKVMKGKKQSGKNRLKNKPKAVAKRNGAWSAKRPNLAPKTTAREEKKKPT